MINEDPTYFDFAITRLKMFTSQIDCSMRN